jgi:hypothetical protein
MPKPYYDIPYAGPAEMDIGPSPFTIEELFGEVGRKMEEKYPLPEPYRQWAGKPPMTDEDRIRMEDTTREAIRGVMATVNPGKSKFPKFKQPWEMTQEEFMMYGIPKGIVSPKAEKEFGIFQMIKLHKKLIEEAISDGELVPAKVLAEYPELSKITRAKVKK